MQHLQKTGGGLIPQRAKVQRSNVLPILGRDVAPELLGKFFNLLQVGDQFLGQLALRHLVDLRGNSFRQLCKFLRGAS